MGNGDGVRVGVMEWKKSGVMVELGEEFMEWEMSNGEVREG